MNRRWRESSRGRNRSDSRFRRTRASGLRGWCFRLFRLDVVSRRWLRTRLTRLRGYRRNRGLHWRLGDHVGQRRRFNCYSCWRRSVCHLDFERWFDCGRLRPGREIIRNSWWWYGRFNSRLNRISIDTGWPRQRQRHRPVAVLMAPTADNGPQTARAIRQHSIDAVSRINGDSLGVVERHCLRDGTRHVVRPLHSNSPRPAGPGNAV